MPFLRRSPRTRVAPVTAAPTHHRRSFLSRLVNPGPQRRSQRATTNNQPIIGYKSRRSGWGRSRRAEPIIGTHQHHRPTLGDKIHGLGKKIAGALEGRPAKEAAGTRQMRGTESRATRLRRRFL